MDKHESNPARTQADEATKKVKAGPNSDAEEFQRKTGLEGKTDSGPEPDVHGREIPPQD